MMSRIPGRTREGEGAPHDGRATAAVDGELEAGAPAVPRASGPARLTRIEFHALSTCIESASRTDITPEPPGCRRQGTVQAGDGTNDRLVERWSVTAIGHEMDE